MNTITQERVKQLFDYHPSGNLIRKVRMAVRAPAGSMPTCIESTGYLVTMVEGKTFKVHRLIFLWHHGYMPEQVDHINGVRSDSRIENLRAATFGQNQQNKRLQKNNTSGFKGVYWREENKKWYVTIASNKKQIYLGRYGSLLDAVAASISGREKLHGEFARFA
jgi:hypothetical protein